MEIREVNAPGVSSVQQARFPGNTMGTGHTVKQLWDELRGLTEDQLKVTSMITYPIGQEKPKFEISKNETYPKIPFEKLPMTNETLKKMVDYLYDSLKTNNKDALNSELVFLKNDKPGYLKTAVTVEGQAYIDNYFNIKTGEPAFGK
jgi:hypothetical protein